MAHQPCAEFSESQSSSHLPLELQKFHNSEDDLIEQESSFLSSCRLLRDSDDEEDERQDPSASKSNNGEIGSQELEAVPINDVSKDSVESEILGLAEDCGRERLKRHRVEVAGRVWIPDTWGQEELLKDWIDCSAFDAPLASSRIMSARSALVEEGRRTTAGGLRIDNRC
ncbi:hypothetical protein L6164_033846 [Bauhinia variegata]|uniref:Uncharacterized protein n=1 Tax=Bauhinia variegata TaxID=167791 RepID=A0ACB9KTJ0_BAUVA|nr:hypothetical protein L6164_033846 [Bauhinia variegata]